MQHTEFQRQLFSMFAIDIGADILRRFYAQFFRLKRQNVFILRVSALDHLEKKPVPVLR